MNIAQARNDFEFAQRLLVEETERAQEKFALALEVYLFVVQPVDVEARAVDFESANELHEALRDREQHDDLIEALNKIVDARISAAQAAGA